VLAHRKRMTGRQRDLVRRVVDTLHPPRVWPLAAYTSMTRKLQLAPSGLCTHTPAARVTPPTSPCWNLRRRSALRIHPMPRALLRAHRAASRVRPTLREHDSRRPGHAPSIPARLRIRL